ncbi:hypothetical protein IE53DRAFT_19818 [Violaceomyces palustris]|uniref:Uncharacterized protein n=1 Tax=Violaceomyces palustris TaxID=1673888 RepID=A0ACD0P1V9_9BASI|nr:hypothetical protein IE53DRAFT_19818 [Violaceomyces palustris]
MARQLKLRALFLAFLIAGLLSVIARPVEEQLAASNHRLVLRQTEGTSGTPPSSEGSGTGSTPGSGSGSGTEESGSAGTTPGTTSPPSSGETGSTGGGGGSVPPTIGSGGGGSATTCSSGLTAADRGGTTVCLCPDGSTILFPPGNSADCGGSSPTTPTPAPTCAANTTPITKSDGSLACVCPDSTELSPGSVCPTGFSCPSGSISATSGKNNDVPSCYCPNEGVYIPNTGESSCALGSKKCPAGSTEMLDDRGYRICKCSQGGFVQPATSKEGQELVCPADGKESNNNGSQCSSSSSPCTLSNDRFNACLVDDDEVTAKCFCEASDGLSNVQKCKDLGCKFSQNDLLLQVCELAKVDTFRAGACLKSNSLDSNECKKKSTTTPPPESSCAKQPACQELFSIVSGCVSSSKSFYGAFECIIDSGRAAAAAAACIALPQCSGDPDVKLINAGIQIVNQDSSRKLEGCACAASGSASSTACTNPGSDTGKTKDYLESKSPTSISAPATAQQQVLGGTSSSSGTGRTSSSSGAVSEWRRSGSWSLWSLTSVAAAGLVGLLVL